MISCCFAICWEIVGIIILGILIDWIDWIDWIPKGPLFRVTDGIVEICEVVADGAIGVLGDIDGILIGTISEIDFCETFGNIGIIGIMDEIEGGCWIVTDGAVGTFEGTIGIIDEIGLLEGIVGTLEGIVGTFEDTVGIMDEIGLFEGTIGIMDEIEDCWIVGTFRDIDGIVGMMDEIKVFGDIDGIVIDGIWILDICFDGTDDIGGM